ncbi:hypothetical protein KSF_005140 [Reticulibacter mediterranei]|uniref:Uncharacterized protein n=1 Tax=Reticulibacter mediterranei TaxID=2778369 RepID=A0A8J3IHR0_9CHLR|nr:hypothetical protein [Reticulibacter mediterranei]GHO90466.1 hypothetical protein KSF_005140 [Reticulibacter mediterranei]
MKDSEIFIQTSSQSVPSTPSWFGEVTVIAHYLRHLGVLADISERVRLARRRFGHYDLTDFAVVLLGYAISGERTLEAFYDNDNPVAVMAEKDKQFRSFDALDDGLLHARGFRWRMPGRLKGACETP